MLSAEHGLGLNECCLWLRCCTLRIVGVCPGVCEIVSPVNEEVFRHDFARCGWCWARGWALASVASALQPEALRSGDARDAEASVVAVPLDPFSGQKPAWRPGLRRRGVTHPHGVIELRSAHAVYTQPGAR